MPRLIRDGRFIRPALGVTAGAAQLSQSLGAKGVLLVGVVSGGPAAQAGLQAYTRGETAASCRAT